MLGEVLGVERRRRWSEDEKLEVLSEVGVRGASYRAKARLSADGDAGAR